MRVLIYKRTHTGDPDESGWFGHKRCMGQVRARHFDAVIGVGGVSAKPVREGIARRITWVGIGPKQVDTARDGHPILAFEHFYLKDDEGPFLREKAPKLARRILKTYGPRVLMVDSDMDKEAERILGLAMRSPASRGLTGRVRSRKRCTSRRKCGC